MLSCSLRESPTETLPRNDCHHSLYKHPMVFSCVCHSCFPQKLVWGEWSPSRERNELLESWVTPDRRRKMATKMPVDLFKVKVVPWGDHTDVQWLHQTSVTEPQARHGEEYSFLWSWERYHMDSESVSRTKSKILWTTLVSLSVPDTDCKSDGIENFWTTNI